MTELLFFLFSNNFMTKANYFALALICVFLFKSKGKINVSYIFKDRLFIVLVLASFSYGIIYCKNYGPPAISSVFLRFFSPVIFYIYGKIRIKKGVNTIAKDMIVLSFGSFIHGFLNVIINFDTEILTIEGRAYKDIYEGIISATEQNLLMIMVASLLFYFLFCEKNKYLKIAGSLCSLFCVFASFKNASRTLIILTALSFLVCYFVYFFLNKGLEKKIVSTALILIAILFGTLIISTNFFGLMDRFYETELGQRFFNNTNAVFDLSTNLRFTYAYDILCDIPKYLMGNNPYSNYAHNFFLDIAKEAGIIPFILYSIFYFGCILDVIKILKKGTIDISYKILVLSLLIGFTIAFFTEPLMQGQPILFSIFAFLTASVSTMTKQYGRRHSFELSKEKAKLKYENC